MCFIRRNTISFHTESDREKGKNDKNVYSLRNTYDDDYESPLEDPKKKKRGKKREKIQYSTESDTDSVDLGLYTPHPSKLVVYNITMLAR